MNYYQNGELITRENPIVHTQDSWIATERGGWVVYRFEDEDGQEYEIEVYSDSDFFNSPFDFNSNGRSGDFYDLCEEYGEGCDYDFKQLCSDFLDTNENDWAYWKYDDYCVARNLADVLKENGVPIELVCFPDTYDEDFCPVSEGDIRTHFKGAFDALYERAEEWVKDYFESI